MSKKWYLRYLYAWFFFMVGFAVYMALVPVFNDRYAQVLNLWTGPNAPALNAILAINQAPGPLHISERQRLVLTLGEVLSIGTRPLFILLFAFPVFAFALPWFRRLDIHRRINLVTWPLLLPLLPAVGLSIWTSLIQSDLRTQLIEMGVEVPIISLSTGAVPIIAVAAGGIWAHLAFGSLIGDRYSSDEEVLSHAFPKLVVKAKEE